MRIKFRIISLFLVFILIFSAKTCTVKADTIALTPSPQIAGMYQSLPPQAKFAVGVVLVGSGIVYGTIQGKNVVEDYYNANKDTINKQIAVTQSGIITVSKDFVNGVKSYAQTLKNTAATSYYSGDNITVSGSGWSHFYLSTYKNGSLVVSTRYYTLLPASFITYIDQYNYFTVGWNMSDPSSGGCFGVGLNNGTNVYTYKVTNFDVSATVSLNSLKGVDGICSYPTKSIPSYDGTQDLVITPSSGAIDNTAGTYNIPVGASRTAFPNTVSDLKLGKLNPDGTISTGANNWTGTTSTTGNTVTQTLQDTINTLASKIAGTISQSENWWQVKTQDSIINIEVENNQTTQSAITLEQEAYDAAKDYTLPDNWYDSHIVGQHGPDSQFPNKSKFNRDFDIKKGIDDALKGTNNTEVRPNSIDPKTGKPRDGYIFEKTYQEPIGTDMNGNPCDKLKVVLSEDGFVITAYPIQ